MPGVMNEKFFCDDCGHDIHWDGVNKRTIWDHQKRIGHLRARARRAGVDPRSVECPECGSEPGEPCWVHSKDRATRCDHKGRALAALAHAKAR